MYLNFVQAIDCGDKKITVNAVAPGAIKTDMYQAVAREYIPGGQNFTDEQVDEVGRFEIVTCS
jgi:NAD(P)-dependent dehydrogenase (short-subunit alcohol dehydrogenase family)